MSSNEFETMKYFMAAEKVTNLIYSIEMTLQFLEEYNIRPEEEVVKALSPLLDKLNTWMKK